MTRKAKKVVTQQAPNVTKPAEPVEPAVAPSVPAERSEVVVEAPAVEVSSEPAVMIVRPMAVPDEPDEGEQE